MTSGTSGLGASRAVIVTKKAAVVRPSSSQSRRRLSISGTFRPVRIGLGLPATCHRDRPSRAFPVPSIIVGCFIVITASLYRRDDQCRWWEPLNRRLSPPSMKLFAVITISSRRPRPHPRIPPQSGGRQLRKVTEESSRFGAGRKSRWGDSDGPYPGGSVSVGSNTRIQPSLRTFTR